jgi:uncharacterized protein (TIGR02117 family)
VPAAHQPDLPLGLREVFSIRAALSRFLVWSNNMHIHRSAVARAFTIRFLFVLLVLSTTACTTADEWRNPPRVPDNAIKIFVVKHGWHTGVVVPNIGQQMPFTLLDPVLGHAAYYEFGWGDRKYYPENDPGIWLALRAMLWPTQSVLHVVALPDSPVKTFAGAAMEELQVSEQGYLQILDYLMQHFVLNDQSQPVVAGRGLYGNSRFFEAHGSFHAFRTCNTWTAQALQHGGVPVRSFMTLTADSVLSQIRAAMNSLKRSRGYRDKIN